MGRQSSTTGGVATHALSFGGPARELRNRRTDYQKKFQPELHAPGGDARTGYGSKGRALRICVRIPELGVVQGIESLPAKLSLESFPYSEVLTNRARLARSIESQLLRYHFPK